MARDTVKLKKYLPLAGVIFCMSAFIGVVSWVSMWEVNTRACASKAWIDAAGREVTVIAIEHSNWNGGGSTSSVLVEGRNGLRPPWITSEQSSLVTRVVEGDRVELGISPGGRLIIKRVLP